MDFFKTSSLVTSKDNDLKNGDTVIICYLENSPYNTYKGYIGEVKEYRKHNDVATVSLIATSNQKHIRVPIEHFKKLY